MSMEIHKCGKYTITTDGITAVKSDGEHVAKMKYYPERDIAAIAGEIDEFTAWQIIYDIASMSSESNTPISPEHIFIDSEHFVLSPWSSSTDEKFTAPEGYSPVWALAATVFYVYLGCHVFQGLGGKGQTATVPIPTLRKEMPELSGLVINCMNFNPSERPSMNEIALIAAVNLKRCSSSRAKFPPVKKNCEEVLPIQEIDVYWPEEMC